MWQARGRVGSAPALAHFRQASNRIRPARTGHRAGADDAIWAPPRPDSASIRPRSTGVAAPVDDWQSYFLVRPLSEYRDSMRGTFRFPAPFLGG